MRSRHRTSRRVRFLGLRRGGGGGSRGVARGGVSWVMALRDGEMGGEHTVIPDVDFLKISSTATSSSIAASTSIPSAAAALSGSDSCWSSITSSIASHSSSVQGAFLDLSFWIWFCFT